MLASPDGAVLLQHRAEWSHYGGTWGLPGGARASAEPAHTAALREATEEAAVPVAAVRPSHSWIEDHRAWSYTTLVGQAPHRVHAYPADLESHEIRWVPFDEVEALPLHPGFAAHWGRLREQALRRLVLLVDAANVVGSRPDGWWHDRLGASTRLRDALARTARTGLPAGRFGLPGDTWWPDLHLVVEGQARQLAPTDGVAVHAAPADGDSMLAELAAGSLHRRPQDHVVVVTADRALRAIVRDAGAATVGPGTLLEVLPQAGA
ncbi:MAG TPA: NUDIX hydrolase [Jiangellaceae bacterium]|nr:NUDIX hydrolase [Jiangellaceae bacterium]